MDCNHSWIGNRGSNDKPCIYCARYPVLNLRYQCNKCMKEACVICLKEQNQEYTSVPLKLDQTETRNKTLEIRIIQLENTLYALQERILLLELEIQNLKNDG